MHRMVSETETAVSASHAVDMNTAEPFNTVDAAEMSTTEASDLSGSANASHVSNASAGACLGRRRQQARSKQSCGQDHHHSSHHKSPLIEAICSAPRGATSMRRAATFR
jgi:hypothetical protein